MLGKFHIDTTEVNLENCAKPFFDLNPLRPLTILFQGEGYCYNKLSKQSQTFYPTASLVGGEKRSGGLGKRDCGKRE